MARVLAVWLDGFEMELADRWELPTLAAMRTVGVQARLDHGVARLTGLAGEHLSTGLDPLAAKRPSAVHFDPRTYRCRQEEFAHPPVVGAVPTVVLDPCYFDLASTPDTVLGLVDWGGHDPGAPRAERPAGLHDEVAQRFGSYPAPQYLYATPWASPAECEDMGTRLTAAVERRADIASWLLAERLPEWQLALIGVSEAHSGSEGLYHGVDPTHPLHRHPSAGPAGAGLRSVYEAIDRLVARLADEHPDAVIVAFAMHGMGPNTSDAASMCLIGDLMRRWNGHDTPPLRFPMGPEGVPTLEPGVVWSHEVARQSKFADPDVTVSARIAGILPARVRAAIRARRRPVTPPRPPGTMFWMPVSRHQPHWHSMRAFAIPSFYDGRVRVNVVGREAEGLVAPADYQAVLDDIEATLRECTDPVFGHPVVGDVRRPSTDPMQVGELEADLVVRWNGLVLGLQHPRLGTIGPVPPRRTGGHSNPIGRFLATGPGLGAFDFGTRSAFDVMPTLLDWAGSPAPWPISGTVMPMPVAAAD